MSRKSKYLPSAAALLQRLASEGSIEPKVMESLRKWIDVLERSLATGNIKQSKKAAGEIARCLLRDFEK